jgi:uncharacterized protein YutE (UPF0331/DUF86 family)
VVEEATVRRLLEIIELRLRRLGEAAEVPLEVYLEDRDLQDIVERNLEICIQACIDLGLHVLADFPSPLPDTNREVFASLVREGVVSQELGPRLHRMAGFRNVLAHAYAEVVAERVYAVLAELSDIRDYVAQLVDHLDSGEGPGG